MKSLSSRYLLTASVLAVSLGLGIAGAQQADNGPSPEVSPEISQKAQEAANNNEPLSAPDSAQSDPGIMPDTFADLVEQVSPAVVNITTTSVVSQPTQGQGPMFPEGSPFDDLFRDFGFPGAPGQSGPQRSNALGSGFVISADGFIVTNNHVIDGADEIEIEFYSGKTLPAKVVGTDPKTDVAVLKVESEDAIPFVKFGDSDTARVGDWVLALGNPLGQGFSASSGIVSARNRELSGTYDDYLQTDAAINRGNSGGPLFNMKGEVIGVNTAILSPNGGSIGIGFSMTSNVVQKVVAQLQEFGETRRGWLGVKIQDVTPDMAEAMGLSTEGGAMVTDVPDGPALEAGMLAGDVITEFDGQAVSDIRELVQRVADAPVGEPVDVIVQREGEEVTLEIVLGRRETAEGTASETGSTPAQPSNDKVLGMTLGVLTPEIASQLQVPNGTEGLLVEETDPEGAAAEKGIMPGDLITGASQQKVTSVADLNARIEEAREAGRRSVLLLILRNGDPLFVALPLEEKTQAE